MVEQKFEIVQPITPEPEPRPVQFRLMQRETGDNVRIEARQEGDWIRLISVGEEEGLLILASLSNTEERMLPGLPFDDSGRWRLFS